MAKELIQPPVNLIPDGVSTLLGEDLYIKRLIRKLIKNSDKNEIALMSSVELAILTTEHIANRVIPEEFHHQGTKKQRVFLQVLDELFAQGKLREFLRKQQPPCHIAPWLDPVTQAQPNNLEKIHLACETMITHFLNNEIYWKQRLPEDPEARYRFCYLKMVLDIQYAMPLKKSTDKSLQVIESVKKVIRLNKKSYSYRRKIVILVNIYVMNRYKLEKQHGKNLNIKDYRRLLQIDIGYPVFDQVDELINCFVRLKCDLLNYLNKRLIGVEWEGKKVDVKREEKLLAFVEGIIENVRLHIIKICVHPEAITQETQDYIHTTIQNYNQDSSLPTDLGTLLQNSKNQWQSSHSTKPSPPSFSPK